MKQQKLFDTKLQEATEIRTHIQDNLRTTYNGIKIAFEAFTGQKGKVLKHVVDMYHYRNGGYPEASSLPKHYELIQRFAWMVHIFRMVGLAGEYKEVLEEFGLKVTVDPEYVFTTGGENEEEGDPIPMPDGGDIVVEEALEGLLEYPEITAKLPKKKQITVAQAIRAMIMACDEIQGAICQNSNVIRKEIAPEVERACEIKKGDFSGSVNVNYQVTTGRASKRKVKRLKKSLSSKYTAGSFNIRNMQDEVGDPDEEEQENIEE